MKTIPQDVLMVLDASRIEGNHVYLPPGQLDRKLYAAVNKVLMAAGGKWSRKAAAHVFSGDAADAIEPIILTGEYATPKQDFGQFDTPAEIVMRVIGFAQIGENDTVLEPSAGIGNLAIPASAAAPGVEVTAYEIDPARHAILATKTQDENGEAVGAVWVWNEDFLATSPDAHDFQFDRVVMNPPFAKGADIAHVRHAFDFLKPGGRLVAIMPPSWRFREDRRYTEFRFWTDELVHEWTPLPDGSFKASGTNVSAGILVIDKPKD